MINYNNKEIEEIYAGTKEIQTVYDGTRIVWELMQGNFMTSDGFFVQTSDGFIFNVQES